MSNQLPAPKRLLLTGAGGFIGHHVLEHVLATTTWEVVATDSFRHKGKTDRIAEVLAGRPEDAHRVSVITHDLAAPFSTQTLDRLGPADYVIAMASESHVDRSITDPVPFVRNNVDVILHTLEACRHLRPQAVIVVSTDEVYGPEPIRDGIPAPHPEWAPIIPSNPYSASKAAQEALAISYHRTYGVPVVLVNIMNNIGERQDPEKFLPMLIQKISSGAVVPIHGRPGDIGSRHYLHARNAADAMVFLLNRPPSLFTGDDPARDRPDRWNIVGPDRLSNLALAQMVAAIIGKPLKYQLVDFHSARPGHDPHYGLDPAKLTAAGWKPPLEFADSLERTIRWTLAHPHWLADG